MITYVDSNLFESPAKVLVNTVNTVGVMGKGIAKTFKEVYPEMFKQYQGFCRDGSLTVGKLWLYKTSHKWILNFPTKQHWRAQSKLEYIEAGLQKFADTYDRKSLLQVSFPMLGCGNGELDWEDVRPLMEHYLRPLPIDVYIHLYQQAKDFVPEHRDLEATKQWLRSEPRSLPFSEFWDDLVHVAEVGQQSLTTEDSQQFTLQAITFDKKLRFVCNDKQFVLNRDELMQLWSYVREESFYALHDFPNNWQQRMPFIAAVLQKLPYIRQIGLCVQDDWPNMSQGLSNAWLQRQSFRPLGEKRTA